MDFILATQNADVQQPRPLKLVIAWRSLYTLYEVANGPILLMTSAPQDNIMATVNTYTHATNHSIYG